MNRKKKRESGAVAIETALTLPVFMIAIIALMMFSMLIRAQATMQYALNQTAKEISGYFYLLDKLGIASAISGNATDMAQANFQSVNDSIRNIVSFSGQIEDDCGNITDDFQQASSALDDEILTQEEIADITAMDVDFKNLSADCKNALTTIKGDIDKLKSADKGEMLSGILQVFGKSLLNRGFSEVVTPLVCNALMEKYMTSGDKEAFYEATGIDPTSISFYGSDMLADGRTISLVVNYELDASKLSLGFYRKRVKIQQVASTSAWIHPNTTGSLLSLSDVSARFFDEDIATRRSEELNKIYEAQQKQKEEAEKKRQEIQNNLDERKADEKEDGDKEEEEKEKPDPSVITSYSEDIQNALKNMSDEEQETFFSVMTLYDENGRPYLNEELLKTIEDLSDEAGSDRDARLAYKTKIVHFLATDFTGNSEPTPDDISNELWRQGRLKTSAQEKLSVLEALLKQGEDENGKTILEGADYQVKGYKHGDAEIKHDALYDVLTTTKGNRPDPRRYLSDGYIDDHLQQFRDEGFTVIQNDYAFNRFTNNGDHNVGYGADVNDPRGSLFIIPRGVADAAFDAAKEAYDNEPDPSKKNAAYTAKLEKMLGFDEGTYTGQSIYRIDVDGQELVDHPDQYHLRLPSGNEQGANGCWVPGGFTSGGTPEAIVDQIQVTKDNCKLMFDKAGKVEADKMSEFDWKDKTP